jgi:hypothetical protein
MPEKNDLPPILETLGENLYAAMKTADSAQPVTPRWYRLKRPTRPTAGTPRAARRWAAVAVAAIAVGVGVFVLGGTGGAPTSAFAGWSAAPTAPASGETAGALEHCRSQLAGAEGPQSGIPAAGWKPLLTCFNGPSFTSVMAGSAQGSGASEHVFSIGSASGAPPSGPVMMLDGSGSGPINTASLAHLTTSGGQPYTFLQGSVHAGVTGVALVLSNGSKLEASLGDGSFVAWWPGSAEVNSARMASAAGAITQQLTFTALSAPKGEQGPTSPPAGGRRSGATASAASGPTSGPQVHAALAKCRPKLPPRSTPWDVATMTKFLACMKTSGVTIPTTNPTK